MQKFRVKKYPIICPYLWLMGQDKSQKHRGKIVEKTVRQSGIPVTEVARRISIARKTLYNYFEREKLSWDKIIEVYQAISRNVYTDFPEAPGLVEVKEPEVAYNTKRLEECEKELKELYKKYTEVLEENSRLKDRIRKLEG